MMATKVEPDFDHSSANNESDFDDQDELEHGEEEQEEEEHEEEGDEEVNKKPKVNNVSDILKRLQSSGALIKKPKKEYECFTCEESFPNWEILEKHLIQHVSLPSVLITKLQSDDDDYPPSGDEWSDEDEVSGEINTMAHKTPQKMPQKIDISQILNKPGLSIKKTPEKEITSADSALSKLTGLGFTIKKNITPVKQEKPEFESHTDAKDVMQKLGQLGGIKLKLKSDGSNTNSFKVVNGLKDFKTSDDEDSAGENRNHGDSDEEDLEKDCQASADEQNESDDEETNEHKEDNNIRNETLSASNKKLSDNTERLIVPKTEPDKTSIKEPAEAPILKSRPAVKQTPKRGANLPAAIRDAQQAMQKQVLDTTLSAASTPERRSSGSTNSENIVVKQEIDTTVNKEEQQNAPLFSNQIKTERSSPPPFPSDSTSTPIITTVKTEPDSVPSNAQSGVQNQSTMSTTTQLLPINKTEDIGMTVIEINGDSNDEDDDCCVVSTTPAPDIKPKVENPQSSMYVPANSFTAGQQSYNSTSSRMPTTPSTEKQHSFNWNAPDTKPAINMLETSADDIFESLLSSSKKENSLSDASEYISLDTLGPNHSCEVCNVRFTSINLLEEHKRMTGHSTCLVTPSSSSILPYTPTSSNILSSLLPVGKQMVEQIGKMSGMGSGPGFTHQQNVMINIQAYPGGAMGPPPPYNAYSGQNVHSNFQDSNSMYNSGQTVPGQYPGQSYMGPGSGYGQQFQQPMSKPAYPGAMPQNTYSVPPTSSPYSTTSPLQSMQQAVYAQQPSSMMNQQMNHQSMGQMGPPSQSYIPSSSPGGVMKSENNGIKIQNVQTFTPGQPISSGQSVGSGAQNQQLGSQMPSPGPIRMAPNASVSSTRPRMPLVRGPRPSVRPGIQVHGQVRGIKPGQRMPMKRPTMPGNTPPLKRRADMLLPGKHDNEDCQVMSMQKQRDGMPMIQSVQGAKDKLNLGSQISITKKTVNKEASAMANVLAMRGISIKQKQKSRSPSPERPVPHIPNLGSGVSIKHTSKSNNFTIPESKVGSGMLACKICKKMFMNQNSLAVHMTSAHPYSKIPVFKCDECPASYPKSLQLQHHKRIFHNVTGPNKELGLPVVDISQEETLKRLSNIGIYSFIPLAPRDQGNGSFGIPVISVQNMQNGKTTSLHALGADGLLSLGPLKTLPNS